MKGVEYLFGNPGTTELPVMNALANHPSLQYVLGLQEGTVVAMADGFSRASGRLSACNVHVAPGLGNAMGSLYNAKWSGSPIIVTAGQQERGHGLTEPMLYDSLVPIAAPLVKWAVEVERFEDLPRVVHRAAKIATTPPTGPVFISLPGDILNATGGLGLGHSTRVNTQTRPVDEVLKTLTERLVSAHHPVIIAGHEVATHDALNETATLAELLGAPVFQQTVPDGAHFLSEHPCFMGSLNRNQAEVRERLAPYDLMICVGADVLRMSVWSPVEALPESLPIVQLGLLDWEMGKNYPTELAIRADVKQTLTALLPLLEQTLTTDERERRAAAIVDRSKHNWSAIRERLCEQLGHDPPSEPIDPRFLMMAIADHLPPDAVMVDEGIVSARSLLSFFPFRDPGSYYGLASGGIGFAVAGAIGIKLAHPDRPVTAIIGDGSAMYNIQALWTAAHLNLPITYLIANNQGYRILKERLTEFHGSEAFIGMDFERPAIDFVELAHSLGVRSERISTTKQIHPALDRAAAHAGPSLIDVMVS